jgi:hypothetical protein
MMMGDLRKPIVLSVRGTTEVVHTTLHGLRGPAAPRTRISLPDTDDDYTVTWSQCSGKETERRVVEGPDPNWSCGQANEYARETHRVRRGEPSTFILRSPPPPDDACLGALTK